ncbi:MAG: hypothetical protein CMJ48_01335 [Planctomycetaceae bacterium]|nr:hypothetical protein [Planctomycetaceae bacterium]
MRPPLFITNTLALGLLLLAALPLRADDAKSPPAKQPAKSEQQPEKKQPPAETPLTVEELAEKAGKSVAVVTFTGRDGKQMGLGSGFVISKDGLIATNLHVIGEARPISVKFADGGEFKVQSIHATQRLMDLAILKIDAQNLPALELGDSDALKQGQSIVALGNPRGLQHSVVSGVVSGKREIDGKPMIQLAIPIESGNSGGPVLDMFGRVHGIVTLKSLVTENLGFAVTVNALKPLLEKPNPVPISRWLTIGALRPEDWKPIFGAHWRQRAGRIHVDGRGDGFGGRSLCLSKHKLPKRPYEVATWVRLANEDGAAGIAFCCDGSDKHYGFYPSNGQLRFSRFDGPDVFSWRVLQEVRTRHFHPGEWNHLKVRLGKDQIRCYVNDHLVVESSDKQYTAGRVALAKFRDTRAEFRGFQIAETISPIVPDAKTVARILNSVEQMPTGRPPGDNLVEKLTSEEGDDATTTLRTQARELELQAKRLRQLADAVHQQKVQSELVEVLKAKEETVDLLRAALLIARLDNDELDVEAYVKHVDNIVEDVRRLFPKKATDKQRIETLDRYLFEELGFHGSRTNYYNRSNSYLNETLDDRENLPITLSVLYMEMARRLNLNVVGVGLPGHFVVRFEPQEGDPQLIDVFDRGKRVSRARAAEIVRETSGQKLRDEHLIASSRKMIVTRMLSNLVGAARDAKDAEAMLRYVNAIVAMLPADHEQRFFRGILHFQTGRLHEAVTDADWLLDQNASGVDLERVRDFKRVVLETQRRQSE